MRRRATRIGRHGAQVYVRSPARAATDRKRLPRCACRWRPLAVGPSAVTRVATQVDERRRCAYGTSAAPRTPGRSRRTTRPCRRVRRKRAGGWETTLALVTDEALRAAPNSPGIQTSAGERGRPKGSSGRTRVASPAEFVAMVTPSGTDCSGPRRSPRRMEAWESSCARSTLRGSAWSLRRLHE